MQISLYFLFFNKKQERKREEERLYKGKGLELKEMEKNRLKRMRTYKEKGE